MQNEYARHTPAITHHLSCKQILPLILPFPRSPFPFPFPPPLRHNTSPSASPSLHQRKGSKTQQDSAYTGNSLRRCCTSERHGRRLPSNCAIASAAAAARVVVAAAGRRVAAGEGEVGAVQAGGVAGVHDDGAVAEESAYAGGGGFVEVEVAKTVGMVVSHRNHRYARERGRFLIARAEMMVAYLTVKGLVVMLPCLPARSPVWHVCG